MVETDRGTIPDAHRAPVSVLYREPMWLKRKYATVYWDGDGVSVLYREPMWLKHTAPCTPPRSAFACFSALP